MQDAGDIRRRDNDSKRTFGGVYLGAEEPLPFPKLIPFLLCLLGVVLLGKLSTHQV
jgi:hypothetical protein